MDKEKLELYYYIHYECRFCGKEVLEKDLDKHQQECEEEE